MTWAHKQPLDPRPSSSPSHHPNLTNHSQLIQNPGPMPYPLVLYILMYFKIFTTLGKLINGYLIIWRLNECQWTHSRIWIGDVVFITMLSIKNNNNVLTLFYKIYLTLRNKICYIFSIKNILIILPLYSPTGQKR